MMDTFNFNLVTNSPAKTSFAAAMRLPWFSSLHHVLTTYSAVAAVAGVEQHFPPLFAQELLLPSQVALEYLALWKERLQHSLEAIPVNKE